MDTGTASAARNVRPLRQPPILSCYFPLGDPLVGLDLLDVFIAEGVDVIEIGMSAPDPFLDGPDIRSSMARADRANWRVDLDRVLEHLAQYARPPKALLMTYVDTAHPALSDTGLWRGIDSLLVVARKGDRLALAVEQAAVEKGVALSAFLSLPLANDEVTRARSAAFYVMLQAAEGQTGPRETLDGESHARIARLRADGVDAPILLGFGISSGRQAREARDQDADGIIVGSQVLRAALAGRDELKSLLRDLRSGLDA